MSFPAWLKIDPSPGMALQGGEEGKAAWEPEPSPGEGLILPTKRFSTGATTSAGLQVFLQAALLLNLQVLEVNSSPGAAEGLKGLPSCMGDQPGNKAWPRSFPILPLLLAGGTAGKKKNADLGQSWLGMLVKVIHT